VGDKIATRLAQILNKFNSGEKLSVGDLVEEFGVTKRTIQRDIMRGCHIFQSKKRMDFIVSKSII